MLGPNSELSDTGDFLPSLLALSAAPRNQFFQGVGLQQSSMNTPQRLLPSVQAYENSGLARFGIGSGYRPTPYMPQNFMAPALAAARVRAQEPVAPITDPLADSGGGGPGAGDGNGPGSGGTPNGPGGESNGTGPTAGQAIGIIGAIASQNPIAIAKSLFDVFSTPPGPAPNLSPLEGMIQGLQEDPSQAQNDADPGPATIGSDADSAPGDTPGFTNDATPGETEGTTGLDAMSADAAAAAAADANAAAAAAAAAADGGDGSDGSGNGDSASADGGGDYAKGGRPPVGKLAVVGEEGPELFVPDKPGTILPHHVYMQLLRHTMSGRK